VGTSIVALDALVGLGLYRVRAGRARETQTQSHAEGGPLGHEKLLHGGTEPSVSPARARAPRRAAAPDRSARRARASAAGSRRETSRSAGRRRAPRRCPHTGARAATSRAPVARVASAHDLR